MKLTDKAAIATHRVIVYGAPKTGKSLLIAKLAEHYKLNWFDNEQGWMVLKSLPVAWQERINLITIPDSRTYPIAAETWLKLIKGDAGSICDAHGKWNCPLCKKDGSPVTEVHLNATQPDTINVFDGLTQFTNSLISHVTKTMPDDYKLQLDDWGNLKVLIDKFLSQVQAARYNVCCVTHEELVEFDDGKKRLVPSAGSAKSSMNTAKYFDDVIFAEVKNKKHTFGSGSTFAMNAVTGSRSGVEIEKSAVPSLLDIFTEYRIGMEIASPMPTPKLSSVEMVALEVKEQDIQAQIRFDTSAKATANTPGNNALANLKLMAQKGTIK